MISADIKVDNSKHFAQNQDAQCLNSLCGMSIIIIEDKPKLVRKDVGRKFEQLLTKSWLNWFHFSRVLSRFVAKTFKLGLAVTQLNPP
jgi:hypothetical protein